MLQAEQLRGISSIMHLCDKERPYLYYDGCCCYFVVLVWQKIVFD